ncbi:hypothetical protein ACIQB5_47260 [Streptomyces sp. NPDC088560]|uniref:hypothetical protein n=1 Tax=Streptomyces sp. NPDC088560 TaxID=3365868 RepID=UPI00381639DD
MKHLRDSRAWVTVVTTIVVGAGPACLIGMGIWDWKFGLPTDDRVAIVNTVIAAASWLLVAVAGVVALLAYLDASGRPDLHIEITFNFSFPNEPVFLAADAETPEQRRQVVPFKQVRATVTINNASLYAAKNPGVRIELEGLRGIDNQSGWHAEWAHMLGIHSIQWEGSTDSIVHGKWSRTLPGLDFTGLTELAPGNTALVVTLVADGVAPVRTRTPVRILNQAEYGAYTDERNVRLEVEPPATAV